MTLSAPLASWEETLAPLPESLKQLVVPWLLPITRLLDNRERHIPSPEGEPDGYAGITRRGPFSRLLKSAWVIAEEFPEEFLRRATCGELPFFETARRSPAASLELQVLVDAGPAQLGAPRLGHIAALIVLAERARRTRGTLRWGIVQHPDAGLHDGFDATGLRALLRGRSPHLASAELRDRWNDHQHWKAPGVERWVLGDPEGIFEVPRVRFESPRFEEHTRLELRVDPRHGLPAQRITLEMPKPSLAAQVLRDPFATESATPLSSGSSAPKPYGLHFSDDERALIFRSTEHDLQIQPLRSVPHLAPPKRKRITPKPGEHIIAGTRHGRRTLALARDQRGILIVYGRGKRQAPNGFLYDQVLVAERAPCFFEPETRLAELHLGADSSSGFWVRFSDGETWWITPAGKKPMTYVGMRTQNTIAVRRPFQGPIALVEAGPGQLVLERNIDALKKMPVNAPKESSPRGFWGPATSALEVEPKVFELWGSKEQRRRIAVGAEMRAVGVDTHRLLVLAEEQHLARWDGSHRRIIHRSPKRVVDVAVGHRTNRAALMQEDGTIVVVHLRNHNVLDRIEGSR